ncbi:MAG: hypothetical protein ABFS35_00700 [Bacteroidota bacterium]
MNNKINILLSIVFVALGVYSLVRFFMSGSNSLIINIIIILLAINLVFNRIVCLIFNKKKIRLLIEMGFNNINLQQIAGLEKVKTIIFSKQGLISQGKYKLINVEHRSTISKKSVIETASQLAELWDSPYTKVLQKKLKKKPLDKGISINQKQKEGISVTDENNKILMLGAYSFVKEFIKKNDGSSLYLVKNNVLIGKFTFKEKWNKKVIDVVKNLNQFGNLVYLDSEPENENTDKLPFDKSYTNLNFDEQKEIINKLSNKAKTALVTTDKNLEGIAGFDFFISDSDSSIENKNCIIISLERLNIIHNIFSLSKKVHNQLNSALSFLLLLNIAFILYFVLRVL